MFFLTLFSACGKSRSTQMIPMELRGSYADSCAKIENQGSRSTFELAEGKVILGTLEYAGEGDCNGAANPQVIDTLSVENVSREGEVYDIKTSLFSIKVKLSNGKLMVLDNENGEVQNVLEKK